MPFKISLSPRISPLIAPSPAEPKHEPPSFDSSCSLRLLLECQTSGPVTGFAALNSLLYSSTCSHNTSAVFHSCAAPIGLAQPVSGPLIPPSSAVATHGSSWVATANKNLRIRLWRLSPSGAACQLQQQASLPSFRQIFHNWTLQRRYDQTHRHGKKYPWMQHSDTISALAFSLDGTLLYSASWDRTVKVWSLDGRNCSVRCRESFTAHMDSINAMLVVKDGLLYTGSADQSIKVWSRRRMPATGRRSAKRKHSMIVALKEHRAAVNALAMSSDGSLLYSGGSDGRIFVWKRSWLSWPWKGETTSQLFEVQECWQAHERAVLCLDVMHTNDVDDAPTLLFSGSADKTVRVWRQQHVSGLLIGRPTHDCMAVVKAHTRVVRSIRVAEDNLRMACGGNVIFSGDHDGSLKIWKFGA